jgi:hypothetical protein
MAEHIAALPGVRVNGQQLDIFHQGSERDSPDTVRETPPAPLPTPAASRSGQTDYAGQLGDDGSLHFMATGQPQP